MVAHQADTRLVEMTHRIEMVEGEVRGMKATGIGMRCAATETLAETGTEIATETAAAIDEATVENDTESLRQGETTHLPGHLGRAEEEGTVARTDKHFRLLRRPKRTGRMKDGDLDRGLEVEWDLQKDHAEEAITEVTMADKRQAAGAAEVEMKMCH